MLALNMTVAVGTLNYGILFYANIVGANTDAYFMQSMTPNLTTTLIAWLNLEIGFDVCFFANNEESEVNYRVIYKALILLSFPAYLILLVIIVIVISEYSSKFAKIISKGNPVAVLDTVILLSYAKFINAIRASGSLVYWQPTYGSHNVDVIRLGSIATFVERSETEFKAIVYFFSVVCLLITLAGIIYTTLVFSWQWLLVYQDKAIFKWVRYQKLHHFLEPYHAPYTSKYRYWTGLLLFVRILLGLVPIINFSFNPRIDLMSTILVVGSLILLKGVTARRLYKNCLLDIMETAIYFNLVTFSALTWYNFDFPGGNQIAVVYISVMVTFVLLLIVIVFHVLRYTRLYKHSFVEKAFKWMSLEKKPKQEVPNDAPEELDGYQLERPEDQELPIVTHSTIEIHKPCSESEPRN